MPIPSLKRLCQFAVAHKNFPKEALAAAHAGYNSRRVLEEWMERSPIKGRVCFPDEDEAGYRIVNFVSQPEWLQKYQRYLFKLYDGHHALVNLRSNVCCDKVGGIKRKAFEDVALSGKTDN